VPSGKAKLVDYMTLFPQTDILGYGNTENQEPALSLGYDIPDYGHVYITAHGMAWIAEQFGYLPGEKHANATGELALKLERANARIAELEEILNEVPLVAERMMENVRNAAIAAITDLGRFTDPGEVDGGEEAEPDDAAPVGPAGGDSTPSRKPRRANV
jgi:hypothetical protein